MDVSLQSKSRRWPPSPPYVAPRLAGIVIVPVLVLVVSINRSSSLKPGHFFNRTFRMYLCCSSPGAATCSKYSLRALTRCMAAPPATASPAAMIQRMITRPADTIWSGEGDGQLELAGKMRRRQDVKRFVRLGKQLLEAIPLVYADGDLPGYSILITPW
jgi:hypothetical protein